LNLPVTTATRTGDLPITATAPSRLPVLESEDWLAVLVGFLSLLLVLAGVRPALPEFGWATIGDLSGAVLTSQNLTKALISGAGIGVLAGVGVFFMNGSIPRFVLGFPIVLGLAWLSQLFAGHAGISSLGFEYVIFALGLGLLVSNTIGVPAWLKEAARTEYYIKTGLVILGAGMLFSDLARGGLLGIVQAVLVVVPVWFVCFWLARRLQVDDELATMLATAVSICGVSAAIAACGAIQGDRKKLSYVTSLVLLVAAPMIVAMPQMVNAFGIPDVVGGAWLGGTLDTSASVVAAGEVISEPARNAGVVVKLSQNVLIGVAAFILTIWWALRNPSRSKDRLGAGVIWERFPKFVLGFLVASLVVSFLIDPSLVGETKGVLAGLRTVWFALAFVSIGLETRFADLLATGSGRPAAAFLGGQAFNVIWTLILAYLLFGGIFFAAPTFD
jgi:uncharacterized integral membrane protein (TIGR00698 family)